MLVRGAVLILFILFSTLSRAQDPVPTPRPVGVKITRPGMVGIAGVPPVGGTLVVFGYSLEEPPAGDKLQGITTFYEYTAMKRMSLFLTMTEPLVRNGQVGIGDSAPGVKFLLTQEGKYLPLIGLSYAVKVPTATETFGTGLYDHKVNLHVDKNIGVDRWTYNFATAWCRQKSGDLRRTYSPALAYLTRFNDRWGGTLQGYWTTNGKGYGGIVAAPFVQVKNTFNIFCGGMRHFGRPTTQYGLVAGFNYIHRPKV